MLYLSYFPPILAPKVTVLFIFLFVPKLSKTHIIIAFWKLKEKRSLYLNALQVWLYSYNPISVLEGRNMVGCNVEWHSFISQNYKTKSRLCSKNRIGRAFWSWTHKLQKWNREAMAIINKHTNSTWCIYRTLKQNQDWVSKTKLISLYYPKHRPNKTDRTKYKKLNGTAATTILEPR